MIQLRTGFSLVAILLLASNATAAGSPAAESILIEQQLGAYEVTVPVSKLAISIPRGGFALEKSPTEKTKSPRYFYLEDTTRTMIISGWFEPEESFPGIRESWENDTRQWRDNGLPEPRAVSFARISDWEAVIYDMATPFGSNSHIRAHWVQAGTWIDLHLSVTADRTIDENRAELKRVLKSISVRQKP